MGNLPYVSLYNNDHSLNVAEALSRLRYWTGEPGTDRPWAKPAIKLMIDALERHFTENSPCPPPIEEIV